MAKYLGIDWGEKKIGLAVSDGLGLLAKPLAVIRSDIAAIIEIIETENIDTVVVGLPRNMDGSLGRQAEKVKEFYNDLKKQIQVQVVFEDETNTSRLVKSQMIKEGLHPEKNRDLIDQKAAQIILQGYLDENNN